MVGLVLAGSAVSVVTRTVDYEQRFVEIVATQPSVLAEPPRIEPGVESIAAARDSCAMVGAGLEPVLANVARSAVQPTPEDFALVRMTYTFRCE